MKHPMQGSPSRARPEALLLNRAPLGYLEALVCRAIAKLGPKQASGLNIVRDLTAAAEADQWDPGQVYPTLARLQMTKGCVRHVETIRQLRGPPIKTYELTDRGAEELRETIAHFKVVLAYLEDEAHGAPAGDGGAAKDEGESDVCRVSLPTGPRRKPPRRRSRQ
jgi:DNA-binding PadR family transcriptional regulator